MNPASPDQPASHGVPQAMAERWHAAEERCPDLLPHCRAQLRLHPSTTHPRYACLLLHGFNSAPGEVLPQAAAIAESLDAHLLAPRLPGHGSADPLAMRGMTASRWIAGVQAAYDDARALASEVVVIGSSLGGSLALELASRWPVAALVLWSPGIRPVEADLLDRFCSAGDEVLSDTRPRTAYQEHWNRRDLHVDGFRALRDIFTQHMTNQVFSRVSAPTWLGYYYRDEQNQDVSSRVGAMLGMFDQIATPTTRKTARAFLNAAHNLAAPERSPEAHLVVHEGRRFLEGQLRADPG